MSPERKTYLQKRRIAHKLDHKQAVAIERLGIVEYPMDLPSLDRAAFDYKPRVPFLSTGADWLDKPRRVAEDAIDEIRTLRTYILENLNKAIK